jgi:hypothetical protein
MTTARVIHWDSRSRVGVVVMVCDLAHSCHCCGSFACRAYHEFLRQCSPVREPSLLVLSAVAAAFVCALACSDLLQLHRVFRHVACADGMSNTNLSLSASDFVESQLLTIAARPLRVTANYSRRPAVEQMARFQKRKTKKNVGNVIQLGNLSADRHGSCQSFHHACTGWWFDGRQVLRGSGTTPSTVESPPAGITQQPLSQDQPPQPEHVRGLALTTRYSCSTPQSNPTSNLLAG